MIRTGKEYIESLRDGRELYLGDEEVKDVTTHPKLRPTIESIARCYDLTWNRRDEFTFEEDGEVFSTLWLIPKSKHDFVRIRRHIMACMKRLQDVSEDFTTTFAYGSRHSTYSVTSSQKEARGSPTTLCGTIIIAGQMT